MQLRDFLQEHRIDFRESGEHHHATRNRIQVDCPYCSKDSGRFRLGIALDLSRASCWTCGNKYLASVLCELTQVSFHKIKELLGDTKDSLNYEKQSIHRGTLKLPEEIGNLLPIHRKYLIKRGFDPEYIAETYKVKGIGLSSKLAWRLFIPIHLNNEIVSWTTRSLTDTGSRYFASPRACEKVSAKTLLYASDRVRHAAIVVEGPFDVFSIGDGAVATMGLVVSNEQVFRIAKYPIRVICFDSEPLAQTRARKLCKSLEVFPGVTYQVSLSGKDAASSPKSEIKELRKRFLD
jgi:hypothetical protein